MSIDPRDLFVSINPTGLAEEELLKGRSGFVDHRTHSDYLIFLAGYNANTVEGMPTECERHRPLDAEGCKPEIDITPSGSTTTASTLMHGLDKAEGEQPDLNFQLLLLAERSCSLLEDWIQHTSVRDQDLDDQIKATREVLEAQSPTWSSAVRELLAERRRQVREEGYTLDRDNQYTEGQLAEAASSYAFWAEPCSQRPETLNDLRVKPPALWPWAPESWKPTNQRLMLIKAGALILAELERLDRKVVQEVRHEG